MARTVQQIKADIISRIQAEPTLQPIWANTSQVSFYNTFAFIMASSIAVFEQILDVFKVDTQTIADNGYYGSEAWWITKLKYFQFDATNPQVIQIINGIIAYPIIDNTLNILTAISLNRTVFGLQVKVATGTVGALQKLTSDQLNALQDYCNKITPVGINCQCLSFNPDLIRIEADVYFGGQYNATQIKANVISALNTYLSNLNFGSTVYVNQILESILNVSGVSDCVLKNISVHIDSKSISDSVFLIQANTNLNRDYNSLAGYLVSEPTTGNSFTDTINCIQA